MKKNKVICPPCGENVALATKRGANKVSPILPLLPRLTAVLPPQGREMSSAFTLIELLVVVLIIGILAAVAVPQYEGAVWKARFSELLVRTEAMQRALDVYVLQHGASTENKEFTDDDLDISVFEGLTPGTIGDEKFYCSEYVCYRAVQGGGSVDWTANMYKDKSHTNQLVSAGGSFSFSTNSWNRYCYYETDWGKKLCAQVEALGWEDVGEGF